MSDDVHAGWEECGVAIPCRADEPALGATLAAVWREWCAAAAGSDPPPLDMLVCVNGPHAAGGPAAADAERFAAAHRDQGARVRLLPVAVGTPLRPDATTSSRRLRAEMMPLLSQAIAPSTAATEPASIKRFSCSPVARAVRR
jgi:hypothetical protein